MAALYQQNLQKALHLHEGGDLAGALKLTSATVAEMRKKGELVTPLGLETLLVHGKYLYESHDIASAEAVYRECCNLTKRDVEVPNDLPELMFARLDTLFQLLLASGQPEMALGVAKERVAQEKKYPNDPSAGIGLILFGLAKQEIGGKAEVVQKTEKKKKGKKTAAAAAAPKKEWLVQEDGNETVLDESTGMDEVLARIGMPKEVAVLLRDYGVEEVSDLGQMQVNDYEQAGLTTDQFQAISKYMASNKFEVIGKDLTLYTSRLLGQGTSSSLEVVEGKFMSNGKPISVAVKKLGAHLKEDVEAALQMYRSKRIGDHPNIVMVYEQVNRSFFTYVAVQRCVFNLNRLFDEPGVISREAYNALKKCENQELRLVRELVSGVAYLHQHLGRCTNELKPRSILIDPSGRLKINDFSIHSTGTQERTLTSFTTLQQGGNMGWRAPEVVNNMPRTAESDSFSVGLLAFFLLSKGHHPFGDGQGKGIDIARDQKIGAGRTPPDLRALPNRLQQTFIAQFLSKLRKDRVKVSNALLHAVFWDTNSCCLYFHRLYDLCEPYLKSHAFEFVQKRAAIVAAVGHGDRKYTNNVADYLRMFVTMVSCVKNVKKTTKETSKLVAAMENDQFKTAGPIPTVEEVTNYFMRLEPEFLANCVQRFGLAMSADEILLKDKTEATKKQEEERKRQEKLKAEEAQRQKDLAEQRRREQEEAKAAQEAAHRLKKERQAAEERARQEMLSRGDSLPRKMEEKKKAKEVAARKEEKSKQKKEKKERKQSVLPPVVNAPSSEPLNVHLAKFGLSDLLEKLTEYGVESCADVHAMQEDDIKSIGLSKEDHKKLLAATLDSSPQESAVVTGEGMSLKQVLRLVGGGNDLYEKLSEYGVGSGEDILALTSDDLDRLELSPSERKILSTGIFGPGAVAVSNDVTYFQNQILGHGATSNVYSGLSLTFGRVAVKVVNNFFAQQVEREIRALKELDAHPNIVSLHGVYRLARSSELALVLSLCVVSLYDVYGNVSPLREEQRELIGFLKDQELRLCLELANGLSYLHNRKGFNHRDLKPQNVLIDRHGVVRISDLGISKARDDDQEKTHTNTGTGTNTGTASITQSGTGSLTATAKTSTMASVGTQAWRAPEVVHTSASSMLRTAKSDCFSMGLVFFFVLSKGTHPYSKSPTDISATIEANINNPKFVIKKLASPIQQHLVAGLLRHDPSERLTSAQVVNHPLFMTNSDKLGFLKTCFDQFPELLRAGAPYAWIKKVPPSIASSSLRSSKLTSPYAETLYDACRFVRNLHEHAVNDKDEVARELQKLLKIPNTPTRSQLAIFVTKTFPELAAFAFDAVKSAVEGKEFHPDFNAILEGERKRIRESVDELEEKKKSEPARAAPPPAAAAARSGSVVPPSVQQMPAAAPKPSVNPPPVAKQAQPKVDRKQVVAEAPVMQQQPQQPQQFAYAAPQMAGYDYYYSQPQQPTQPQVPQQQFAQPWLGGYGGFVPAPSSFFGAGIGGNTPIVPNAGVPSSTAAKFCMACGNFILQGMEFCGSCGAGISCRSCGAKNPLSFNFCGKCSMNLYA